MVAIRIDKGGAVMISAIVLIGVLAMAGNLRAGLLLGILTAASLMLHECGHLVAARAVGVKIHEAGLCRKGPYIRRDQAGSPFDDALISLSGPMVNATIAAALWTQPGVGHWLAIYNLVLLIANLAPLPGSDGRRIFATWMRATGNARVLAAAHSRK